MGYAGGNRSNMWQNRGRKGRGKSGNIRKPGNYNLAPVVGAGGQTATAPAGSAIDKLLRWLSRFYR